MTSPSCDPALGGLRERKKARTKAAIQEHALRLFRAQGYSATTVEQIAEAAEISPSTFFRYFPSKEDVVFKDEFDPLIISSFLAQPADLTPIQAFRAAVRSVFAHLTDDDLAAARERHRMTLQVPELRAAALDHMVETIRMLSDLVAQRVGRDPGDVAVRVFAGAVFGAMMGTHFIGDEGDDVDFFSSIDDALALIEAGLPL